MQRFFNAVRHADFKTIHKGRLSRKNSIQYVHIAIAAGIDVNSYDRGNTALTAAAQSDLCCSVELMEVLVNAKADLNLPETSSCHMTALLWAVNDGVRRPVIEYLIKSKADPQAIGQPTQFSVLHYLVNRRGMWVDEQAVELARYLVEVAGAKPCLTWHGQDSTGFTKEGTPAFYAAQQGYHQVTMYFKQQEQRYREEMTNFVSAVIHVLPLVAVILGYVGF